MLRPLLLATALLALAACGKEEAAAPEPDAGGGPQIATSLEDYALPVDRSAQITAIDAATSDAGGMPGDGGAVVTQPKPEPRPTVDAPVIPEAPVVPSAVIAMPPPPAPTAPVAPAG